MKRYIFVSLLLLGSFVYGQKASRELALSIAINAINASSESSSTGRQKMPARVQNTQITEFSLTGKSSLYKVCSSGNTVFMCTDVNMPAIIAYVEGDDVDMRDLPPAFIDYLRFYEQMSADKDVIKTYNSEWMGASGTSNHRKVSPLLPNDYDDNIYLIKRTTDDNNKSNGSSVWVNPPLLRVPNERGVMEELNWTQDKPYNLYCPVKGGEKTIAGCVAIAMAQVMRYWEWPPGYC